MCLRYSWGINSLDAIDKEWWAFVEALMSNQTSRFPRFHQKVTDASNSKKESYEKSSRVDLKIDHNREDYVNWSFDNFR